MCNGLWGGCLVSQELSHATQSLNEVFLPVEADHIKVVYPSILLRHLLPQVIRIPHVKAPAFAGEWAQDAESLVDLLVNLY